MRKPWRLKCICNGDRPANACRSNGQPVALWKCPTHGNVFEDRASDITLTPFQREVLQAILDEHKAGRTVSAETISWKVNRTVGAIEREMVYLQAINFIEPDTSQLRQGEPR